MLDIFGCLKNISGTWTQVGVDISREIAEDRFGLFVSLSNDGNKLAISGYTCCGFQHGFPSVGYTRIYENNSGNWSQIGEEIDTGFRGVSDIAISADGKVIAIASSGGGSPGWSNFYSGGVKVYKIISGVWTQLGNTFFGDAWLWSYDFIGGVSLTNDGSKIVIGATNTRVYEYIDDEWVQLGEDIETGAYRPKTSLSDSAAILSIGGSITRVYEYNSSNWAQLGININGESSGDSFGSSLELSSNGTALIVGARNNNGNGEDAGHARVYDLSAILSANEFELPEFKLYPNPAKDQLTIELKKRLAIKGN